MGVYKRFSNKQEMQVMKDSIYLVQDSNLHRSQVCKGTFSKPRSTAPSSGL